MNVTREDRALRLGYSTSRWGKRERAPGARLASTAVAVLFLAAGAVTVTTQGMAYAIKLGQPARATVSVASGTSGVATNPAPASDKHPIGVTVPADLAALVLPPPTPLKGATCSYCGPFDLQHYSARGIGGGAQDSAELTKLGFVRGYLGGGRDATNEYSGLVYVFSSSSGAKAYLAFNLSPALDNTGIVPGTLEHFAVPGVAGARGFSVTLKGRTITSYYVFFSRGRMVLLALDGNTGGEALSIQAAQLILHRLSG